MAKSQKSKAPMTDKELARKLFSKSVRKQLKAALSEPDDKKAKGKSSGKRR